MEQRSSVVVWGGKHTCWHKSPVLGVNPFPKYGVGFYILPLCPGFVCFCYCPRKPGCFTTAEVGPDGTEITPVFTRVQTLATERPDWFRSLMAMRAAYLFPSHKPHNSWLNSRSGVPAARRQKRHDDVRGGSTTTSYESCNAHGHLHLHTCPLLPLGKLVLCLKIASSPVSNVSSYSREGDLGVLCRDALDKDTGLKCSPVTWLTT